MTDEKDLLETDRENAIRAHTQRSERVQNSFNKAIEYSIVAIRTILLINGGAAVAMLAFLPSTWPDGAPSGSTEVVVSALWHFAIGTLLAAFVPALSYIAQTAFTESASREIGTWKHPYISKTAVSKTLNVVAEVIRLLAVASAAASLVFFFLAIKSLKDGLI